MHEPLRLKMSAS